MRLSKTIIYPVLLVLLCIVLIFLNYTPNTWLSGWDTLHPEFDFLLNLKRLFFGVWRADQGTGAVAGHSHMADLPRVLYLYLLHYILPIQVLRYAYMFTCLIAGTLGMYFVIKEILSRSKYITLTAFIAAVFYICNLGTIQQFYVPFEMFPTQWGFLPWIILFTIQFLKKTTKSSLLLFSIITLLATPQAYAAHLWYPFFGVYVFFVLLYVIFHKTAFISLLKKAIILVVLTLVINSFWLLPNIYFIFTSSSIPKAAKQNRIYSQEYRLRNREHGYIKDVALLKGFYFNWPAYNFKTQHTEFLMPEWIKHTNFELTQFVGYGMFMLVAYGLLVSFRKKNTALLALSPFFIIPFLFLMNHTPIFEQFFDLLLKIPILEETLRFVFTKFSIMLTFAYAIYFGYAISLLFEKIKLNKHIITIFICLLLFYYISPAFTGNFISQKMKINIPREYFQLYSFMNTQPDGSIFTFPANEFSGWHYYDFSYQGSGFLWFGLLQPVFDRDSDRWSLANEQAFREIQYAVYTRNSSTLLSALQKFNISYLLWDKNSISISQKNKNQKEFSRELDTILQTLVTNKSISKLKQFNTISVYKVIHTSPKITLNTSLPTIYPDYSVTHVDHAYNTFGIYSNENNISQANYLYPFRTFINQKDRWKNDRNALNTKYNIITLDEGSQNTSNIPIENILTDEEIITVKVFALLDKSNDKINLFFESALFENKALGAFASISSTELSDRNYIAINDDILPVLLTDLSANSKFIGFANIYSKEINTIQDQLTPINFQIITIENPINTSISLPLRQFVYKAPQLTDFATTSIPSIQLIQDDGKSLLQLSSLNRLHGLFIPLGSLSHKSGYILTIRSKNISGMPLRLCLKNIYSNQCSIYDELTSSKSLITDYFIIPPSDDGIGYTLSIDNISYGNFKTINMLDNITIAPFPFTFLSKLYKQNQNSKPLNNSVVQTSFIKHAPFIYQAQPNQSGTLAFFQSFNKDWHAYTISDTIFSKNLTIYFPWLTGKKNNNHIKINNWANGWIIDKNDIINNSSIIIVFWPQYLQFAGYIGLLVSFLLIVFWRQKRKNYTPVI